MLWNLESDTTADRNAAALNVVWTTATDATRTSKLTLSTVTNAAGLAVGAQLAGAVFSVDHIAELTAAHDIVFGHRLRGTPGIFITDNLADTPSSGAVLELRGDAAAEVAMYLHTDGLANPTIYFGDGTNFTAIVWDYSTHSLKVINAGTGATILECLHDGGIEVTGTAKVDHIAEKTGAHNVVVDNVLVAEGTKRVACGGGSTGTGTTPNGTVTLEINGVQYFLLTSASA